MEDEKNCQLEESKLTNFLIDFNSLIEEYQSQDSIKSIIFDKTCSFIIKKKIISFIDNLNQQFESLSEDNIVEELNLTIISGDNIDQQSVSFLCDNLLLVSYQIKRFALHIQSQENLGQEGILQIGQSISNFQNLQELKIQFDFNNIREIGISGVCQSFQNLSYLLKLTLIIGWNNMIGPQGAKFIGNSFIFLKNLKELDLQICQLNNIQSEGAKGIAKGIRNLNQLQKLDISFLAGNSIGQKGTTSIGKALQYLTQLQSLSINIGLQNNISSLGTKGLFQGINKLQNLQILHLQFGSFNNIGLLGVQEIANSFKNLQNIIDLSFIIDKFNSIGNKEVQILGYGLKYLINMKYFSFTIDEVYVDFDGIQGISDGMQSLKNLKSVIIIIQIEIFMKNQIIQAYFDSISKNPQLSHLICDFKQQKSKKQKSKVIRKCVRLVEFR
ncbi:hypothetical protein TTHERM_00410190 (macronuclear) [Tetrahymena thermophila SB210]|uniref:Kinase domain protein n=1 Tax=Tetrahymena thermophila (strain SB210) TaxID=312017 RepID=I7LW14_TETTS|nr:hypothetical protein TTHERM_00410190 [Tetrahymena thermophila SB210]EAS00567.2 hypothetical protein TTHERM_00410190 [Tetrahymena thermophila SB210]|eukprot:XP_001020812.2 hypothetical protein TTHERM_00410190 [Tetrahymena thermophila SB210]